MIEWHVYTSYPLGLAEAYARWHYYPGPYGGSYATPWLWIDGNPNGSYTYSNWQNLILLRASVATPITARIWGTYNPGTRNGTVYVRFLSDSNATLQGNVLFALTEDSIQYSAPNGDQWHNHVLRDYYPDHVGTGVTLRYQDSVTMSYPFTINSNWVDYRCEIIAMIQNPVLSGQTKEIWQGAKIRPVDLPISSIEENNQALKKTYQVRVEPNLVTTNAKFAFNLPNGTEYKISISDITGRTVRTLNGIASGGNDLVNCELNGVASGIYFYQFKSSVTNTNGKLIVK